MQTLTIQLYETNIQPIFTFFVLKLTLKSIEMNTFGTCQVGSMNGDF